MGFQPSVQTQEIPPVALVTLVKNIGRFEQGKIIFMKKRSPKKETVILERLQAVKDEIKHYPTPIAGCDQQFEFLLSERDRLTLELTEISHSLNMPA